MGDRSGQVLALFAVFSIPLLAMLALGIDWGMLLTARNEAQRAANAGALAGAAQFSGCSLLECAARADAAEDTAVSYAANNWIRSTKIDPSEVTVQVDVDQRKVRVFVDRAGVPTFFAHMLGIPVKPIGAVAAAMISTGGVGQCLMPFFGPDLWAEPGDDNQVPEEDDTVDWVWDAENGQTYSDDESLPAGGCEVDCYQRVQEDGSGTGYGSGFRDGTGYTNDLGRVLNLKVGSPGGGEGPLGTMLGAGNFQLWSVPIPDSDGNCDPSNPEYAQGGAEIRYLLAGDIPCSCPVGIGESYDYSLDEEFDTKPGQTWGNVKQGLDDRIAMDPDAEWDPNLTPEQNRQVLEDSPRTVPIALSSPDLVVDLTGRSTPLNFNNLALVFIQGYDSSTKIVTARFIGEVSGGAGPETGELIEYLRLVE